MSSVQENYLNKSEGKSGDKILTHACGMGTDLQGRKRCLRRTVELWTWWGGEGVCAGLGGLGVHTRPRVKERASEDTVYAESSSSCSEPPQLRGMGRGWEEGQGEGMYTYPPEADSPPHTARNQHSTVKQPMKTNDPGINIFTEEIS